MESLLWDERFGMIKETVSSKEVRLIKIRHEVSVDATLVRIQQQPL